MGSQDNVLVIKGTATGLDTSKGQVYFSLLYNIGSVDEGPTACIPVPPPAPQINVQSDDDGVLEDESGWHGHAAGSQKRSVLRTPESDWHDVCHDKLLLGQIRHFLTS